jgi:riboflavin synthase
MFTGIIEEVGRVASLTPGGGGARVEIAATRVLEDARDGDSIATDGVCLTITRRTERGFAADCSAETLRLTTIGGLRPGAPVNLERALAFGARLGGHLVQGHVEGVGELVARRPEGESVMMRFAYPPHLGRYIVHKGSIAVGGISLTVANLADAWFEVAVIPVTLEQTSLGEMAIGTPVNLETDLIAKYVERLLSAHAATGRTPLSVEALKEMGY